MGSVSDLQDRAMYSSVYDIFDFPNTTCATNQALNLALRYDADRAMSSENHTIGCGVK
jgi:hypothetical protein